MNTDFIDEWADKDTIQNVEENSSSKSECSVKKEMRMKTAIKENCVVWPAYSVSARYSDRDERMDEVEASDYRAIWHREDAPAPVKCLGFACPASSDVCDVCHLNPSFVPPKKKLVRQQQSEDSLASVSEAKLYVRLAVPTSRGRRGTASI